MMGDPTARGRRETNEKRRKVKTQAPPFSFFLVVTTALLFFPTVQADVWRCASSSSARLVDSTGRDILIASTDPVGEPLFAPFRCVDRSLIIANSTRRYNAQRARRFSYRPLGRLFRLYKVRRFDWTTNRAIYYLDNRLGKNRFGKNQPGIGRSNSSDVRVIVFRVAARSYMPTMAYGALVSLRDKHCGLFSNGLAAN
jgi:hypothetical protein